MINRRGPGRSRVPGNRTAPHGPRGFVRDQDLDSPPNRQAAQDRRPEAAGRERDGAGLNSAGDRRGSHGRGETGENRGPLGADVGAEGFPDDRVEGIGEGAEAFVEKVDAALEGAAGGAGIEGLGVGVEALDLGVEGLDREVGVGGGHLQLVDGDLREGRAGGEGAETDAEPQVAGRGGSGRGGAGVDGEGVGNEGAREHEADKRGA